MNYLTQVKNTQKATALEVSKGLSDDASWHAKYKDSAYVYAGALPFQLTEGDLLAVFSQYGEIVDVNLVKDKETGKSKGFAFVAYEDQRSTVLAVDNLNGAKVAGRVIRVDHCAKYRRPKEDEEEAAREERGVCHAFQRGECRRGSSCKYSHNPERCSADGGRPQPGNDGTPAGPSNGGRAGAAAATFPGASALPGASAAPATGASERATQRDGSALAGTKETGARPLAREEGRKREGDVGKPAVTGVGRSEGDGARRIGGGGGSMPWAGAGSIFALMEEAKDVVPISRRAGGKGEVGREGGKGVDGGGRKEKGRDGSDGEGGDKGGKKRHKHEGETPEEREARLSARDSEGQRYQSRHMCWPRRRFDDR
eukprot:jgi/Mesvir1/14944/Mv14620-RA.1